jgi:hypothetical protein
MIKLIQKVNVPTATSQGECSIVVRMNNFTIQDGVRYLEPTEGHTNYDAYLDVNARIAAKDEQLATTSITAVVTRAKLMDERNELVAERHLLLIPDEGMCTCVLRYFAIGENEFPLPVGGLTESYSCFVSELDEYPSKYENDFLNKKYQMKQRVVKFLADSTFLGFDKESDYEIE